MSPLWQTVSNHEPQGPLPAEVAFAKVFDHSKRKGKMEHVKMWNQGRKNNNNSRHVSASSHAELDFNLQGYSP